jgi:hypothetical protein
MRSFVSVLISIFFSLSVQAQNPGNATATGYPENAIIHGTDLESVQVTNGNLHVHIPIWSAKGRGLDTDGSFVYDSKAWFFKNHCYTSGICVDLVSEEPGSDMALTAHGPLDYSLTYGHTTQLAEVSTHFCE